MGSGPSALVEETLSDSDGIVRLVLVRTASIVFRRAVSYTHLTLPTKLEV